MAILTVEDAIRDGWRVRIYDRFGNEVDECKWADTETGEVRCNLRLDGKIAYDKHTGETWLVIKKVAAPLQVQWLSPPSPELAASIQEYKPPTEGSNG